MEFFDSALILIMAVLISCLANQFFPKISIPLIQVALGVIIALGPISFEIKFSPELFLVIFIAPLLFNEGKQVDKKALWRLRSPILSLALGLVLATVLCIGFFVHWIIPSIPLAAAFALAAALAPTDAVAVGSMTDRVELSHYQTNLLEGESLVNDASGIVSFQFAVGAMVTGAFSVVDAGLSFAFTFFGGILVGLVIALLRYLLVRWIRSSGIQNVTFHVLLEILTPFVVFLAAEALHVSGILAVVAAGIAQSFGYRRISPGAAKLNIVSSNVWAVLIFALNGIVFLLLGTQLPGTLRGLWSDSGISNFELVGYVLAISVALLVLRFAWAFIMPSKGDPRDDPEDGMRHGETRAQQARRLRAQMTLSQQAHEALVLSLAGVKGSITLATILTLPFLLQNGQLFPERGLLIFLASGVIVVSLLVANFIMPLVSPKQETEEHLEGEVEAIIEILRSVLRELSWQVHSDDTVNKLATEEVISAYSRRIARIKAHNEIEDDSLDLLRLKAIDWERECVQSLVDEDEVSAFAAYYYLYRLSRVRDRIEHRRDVRWLLKSAREQFAHARKIRRAVQSASKEKGFPSKVLRAKQREKLRVEVNGIPEKTSSYVLKKLSNLVKEQGGSAEDATTLAGEYRRKLDRATRAHGFKLQGEMRPGNEFDAAIASVEATGLQLERDAIQEMFERGKISPKTAKDLRDNVTLMEINMEGALDI